MKRAIVFLFLNLSLAPVAILAQSLDLLTGLHPRPQVSYFKNAAGFPLRFPHVSIIVSNNASSANIRAIRNFESRVKSIVGITVPERPAAHWGDEAYDTVGIFIGDIGTKPQTSGVEGWPDSLSQPESYVIDITSHHIYIVGADSIGTAYGITTLLQLIEAERDTLPALYMKDWPDYPIRWVFSLHNMMVLSQVAEVEAIEDSMAAHKLNGLQQNDFKYSILDWFDNYYYSHVDTMRAHAAIDNVEVIPGVCSIGYSQGELIHDPDMAEGIPTICKYYIESDTGRLIGDARVNLPNGNFENASGGRFPGWGWVDTTVHVDSVTVHSGRYSARAENFSGTAPNGRFIKLLTCSQRHGYHMSAWFKTQGFRGEFNLLAIGFHGNSSRTLTFTQFSVPQTDPNWHKANVIFNTLDYDSLYVYCGVWSGAGGTIWMDDFQIEDAGMTNVLRPPSQMPFVTKGSMGEHGDRYQEGSDYAILIDSVMEKGIGSYTCHVSPSFKRLPGGTLHNGDSVQAYFIRANPVLNDITGDGSTMVCVSEDTLYSIIHDQVRRVDSLLQPRRYMMGHDEIRVMNWDTACQARYKTPAQLLADNLIKCDSIIKQVHPGAERFVWSDMFDSLHNAHNNYYLVNGDLTGDWNMIPKDITIGNWNGGNMDSSLAFFERHGFSQFTSPYYDDHSTANIRAWREAMERHPQGMRGMMYTTWANDYSYLTPFADYAWSAGPMIVHTPVTPLNAGYSLYATIEAYVFTDPYDLSDSILQVTCHLFGTTKDSELVGPMGSDSSTHYFISFGLYPNPDEGFTYDIEAKNSQGITRRTPRYLLRYESPNSVVTSPNELGVFTIHPNPAISTITVHRNSNAPTTILIEDLLGREVTRFETSSESSSLDIHNLPAGIYECVVTEASGTRTALPFVKE